MKRKGSHCEKKVEKRVRATLPSPIDPYRHLPSGDERSITLAGLVKAYNALGEKELSALYSFDQREDGAVIHRVPVALVPFWCDEMHWLYLSQDAWHVALIYFMTEKIVVHEGDVVTFDYKRADGQISPSPMLVVTACALRIDDRLFVPPIELRWPKYPMDYWRAASDHIWVDFRKWKCRRLCRYQSCMNDQLRHSTTCQGHSNAEDIGPQRYEFKYRDQTVVLETELGCHHLLLIEALTSPRAEPVALIVFRNTPVLSGRIWRYKMNDSLWRKTLCLTFTCLFIKDDPSNPAFGPDGKFDEYIIPENTLCAWDSPDIVSRHLKVLIDAAKERRNNRNSLRQVIDPTLLRIPTTLIEVIANYVY